MTDKDLSNPSSTTAATSPAAPPATLPAEVKSMASLSFAECKAFAEDEKQDNVEAWYELGLRYLSGSHVEPRKPDQRQAFIWLKKAADVPHLGVICGLASYWVGRLLETSGRVRQDDGEIIVPKDCRSASHYYAQSGSVFLGNIGALNQLRLKEGAFPAEHFFRTRLQNEAIAACREAIKRGIPDAYHMMAMLWDADGKIEKHSVHFDDGSVTPAQIGIDEIRVKIMPDKKAVEYKVVTPSGDEKSYTLPLDEKVLQEHDINPTLSDHADLDKLKTFIIAKASNAGHLIKAFRDEKVVIDNLQKAAELGCASAQFDLALKLQWGQGITPDIERARYWMETAMANGHLEAKNIMGMFYLFHPSKEKREVGKNYLTDACNRGYGVGSVNLGKTLQSGLPGIPQDLPRAAELIKKHVQLESAAELAWGQCYEYGHGEIKDENNAMTRFETAAYMGLGGAGIAGARKVAQWLEQGKGRYGHPARRSAEQLRDVATELADTKSSESLRRFEEQMNEEVSFKQQIFPQWLNLERYALQSPVEAPRAGRYLMPLHVHLSYNELGEPTRFSYCSSLENILENVSGPSAAVGTTPSSAFFLHALLNSVGCSHAIRLDTRTPNPGRVPAARSYAGAAAAPAAAAPKTVSATPPSTSRLDGLWKFLGYTTPTPQKIHIDNPERVSPARPVDAAPTVATPTKS